MSNIFYKQCESHLSFPLSKCEALVYLLICGALPPLNSDSERSIAKQIH